MKAQIEADKKARAEKAAREKALREGKPLPVSDSAPPTTAAAAPPVAAPPSKSNHHEQARLQIRLPNGSQPIVHTFPSSATLADVEQHVRQQSGLSTISFSSTFPRKYYTAADMSKTVAELGLTPSAVLMVGP